MSDQTYKKPDWNTWGYMPQVTISEAVALSCDIEPESMDDLHDAFKPRPEEFSRRLKIALASTHGNGALKTNGYKEHTTQKVRMFDFATWADEIGFDLPEEFPRQDHSPTTNSQWPWGDHETKLLKHLAAAATRFWKLYDPTDNTTAPTNREVSDWLQTEKNVSERTAEAMASILRPDGLPTGPRK